jgi:hypothetical protein
MKHIHRIVWSLVIGVGVAPVTVAAQDMDRPAPAHGPRLLLRDRPDSVVIPASTRYRAGPFHRAMLGDNYRDLWATPIKVPVLYPSQVEGGLKATEQGGGNQTRSLRLK